jgi:hypothetical protein
MNREMQEILARHIGGSHRVAYMISTLTDLGPLIEALPGNIHASAETIFDMRCRFPDVKAIVDFAPTENTIVVTDVATDKKGISTIDSTPLVEAILAYSCARNVICLFVLISPSILYAIGASIGQISTFDYGKLAVIEKKSKGFDLHLRKPRARIAPQKVVNDADLEYDPTAPSLYGENVPASGSSIYATLMSSPVFDKNFMCPPCNDKYRVHGESVIQDLLAINSTESRAAATYYIDALIPFGSAALAGETFASTTTCLQAALHVLGMVHLGFRKNLMGDSLVRQNAREFLPNLAAGAEQLPLRSILVLRHLFDCMQAVHTFPYNNLLEIQSDTHTTSYCATVRWPRGANKVLRILMLEEAPLTSYMAYNELADVATQRAATECLNVIGGVTQVLALARGIDNFIFHQFPLERMAIAYAAQKPENSFVVHPHPVDVGLMILYEVSAYARENLHSCRTDNVHTLLTSFIYKD